MSPQAVARIVEAAERLYPPAGAIEITLEANPTDAEAARFAALAQAAELCVLHGDDFRPETWAEILGARPNAAPFETAPIGRQKNASAKAA